MKGLSIRVLPSKVQERTFQLLGAEPRIMDLTEALAAIKAGKLDAQENPFSNTVTYGVHQFHRFHTATNHFYVSRPIFVHRPSIRRMAEADRRTSCATRFARRSHSSAICTSRKRKTLSAAIRKVGRRDRRADGGPAQSVRRQPSARSTERRANNSAATLLAIFGQRL